jgi:hypothetical protein
VGVVWLFFAIPAPFVGLHAVARVTPVTHTLSAGPGCHMPHALVISVRSSPWPAQSLQAYPQHEAANIQFPPHPAQGMLPASTPSCCCCGVCCRAAAVKPLRVAFPST